MIVVDIAQHSPEWYEWRKQGISATSLAVILGLSPHKTKRQLWLELMGYTQAPDLSGIPQVKRGSKFEPLALSQLEDMYGQIGLPICAEHDTHRFMRASFDASLESKHPVEIKNLSEDNHKEVLAQMEGSSHFQLYQWQVKHQCVVAGVDHGYLWFWSPKHTPRLMRVDLGEGEAQSIIRLCTEFWQSMLDHKIPPADPARDLFPVDEQDAALQAKWLEISTARRELEVEIEKHKKALAKLNEQANGYVNDLCGLMGNFRCADNNGVRISQYDIKGKVNWEQMVRDTIATDVIDGLTPKYTTQPSQGRRVTINTDYKPTAKPDPKPVNLAFLMAKHKAVRSAQRDPDAAKRRMGFFFSS